MVHSVDLERSVCCILDLRHGHTTNFCQYSTVHVCLQIIGIKTSDFYQRGPRKMPRLHNNDGESAISFDQFQDETSILVDYAIFVLFVGDD